MWQTEAETAESPGGDILGGRGNTILVETSELQQDPDSSIFHHVSPASQSEDGPVNADISVPTINFAEDLNLDTFYNAPTVHLVSV